LRGIAIVTGSTTYTFGINSTAPTTARMYGYFLCGHDNFAADRKSLPGSRVTGRRTAAVRDPVADQLPPRSEAGSAATAPAADKTCHDRMSRA
jgi:hypothetical protein